MISLRQKSALQALHSPQPVVAVLVADEALDILGAGLDRKRMANVQLRAVFIDDLVELGVDLLTRLGIAQTAALLDQFVRLGIAEEGAVAGLALLRGVVARIIGVVGVTGGSDPCGETHVMLMFVQRLNVSRLLIGADLDVDVEFLEHLLDNLTDLETLLGLVGNHDEVAAVGIGGLCHELLCLLQIVVISRGRCVAGNNRRDHAVSKSSAALKDGIDDLLAVNSVADGLTNLQIIGGAILIDQIEEVVEAGHGRPCILDQVGVGVNLANVVGLNGVGNVDLTHFQSNNALGGLRDDLHNEVLGRGFAHEVLIKRLKLDRVGRVPFDHLVRTGADRMLREVFIAVPIPALGIVDIGDNDSSSSGRNLTGVAYHFTVDFKIGSAFNEAIAQNFDAAGVADTAPKSAETIVGCDLASGKSGVRCVSSLARQL